MAHEFDVAGVGDAEAAATPKDGAYAPYPSAARRSTGMKRSAAESMQ